MLVQAASSSARRDRIHEGVTSLPFSSTGLVAAVRERPTISKQRRDEVGRRGGQEEMGGRRQTHLKLVDVLLPVVHLLLLHRGGHLSGGRREKRSTINIKKPSRNTYDAMRGQKGAG